MSKKTNGQKVDKQAEKPIDLNHEKLARIVIGLEETWTIQSEVYTRGSIFNSD